MSANGSAFNGFSIIGKAKGVPDFEEMSMPVEFEGISGSIVFGNHTSFSGKPRQGSMVIIEGHITAMFDGAGELFPIADAVFVLAR